MMHACEEVEPYMKSFFYEGRLQQENFQNLIELKIGKTSAILVCQLTEYSNTVRGTMISRPLECLYAETEE